MTIFIVSWFIAGLLATITVRIADQQKMQLYLYLVTTCFGYLSFLIVFITLMFPWLAARFIRLMTWEI